MPVEWSSSTPLLLSDLDRHNGVPLRSQIETAVREAIRSGRLGPDERVPSSRDLARQLGVSRGLIQECYGQLLAEGYLITRAGSATRVAAGARTPATTTKTATPARLAVDFRTGVPDLASFPRGDWLWAQREVARHAPTASLDYGDPQGSTILREVIASYLRRVRAAAADADHIVICTGFAQALNLVVNALSRAGTTRIAFEDPGYDDTAAGIGETFGVETVPVRVDDRGIDVAALAASGAQAVVLTPAHQWPTGVVLAPERRVALRNWAVSTGGVIIEDDYDAEFRYDREPIGALQGLAPDHVAYAGTVSKALAPSVRLGWIVCPPSLRDGIVAAKAQADRGSPGIDQLVLAALVESGRYDRHLRHMRTRYAARRAALVAALDEHAPAVKLSGLAAGFHAVAHLPRGVSERAVVEGARARSIGLYGMSRYRSSRSASPAQLVLGFGNLDERAIARGIAAIAHLLSSPRIIAARNCP